MPPLMSRKSWNFHLSLFPELEADPSIFCWNFPAFCWIFPAFPWNFLVFSWMFLAFFRTLPAFWEQVGELGGGQGGGKCPP